MLARERKEDIYKREEDGWTLLHWAAFNGHLEVVLMLFITFRPMSTRGIFSVVRLSTSPQEEAT